MIEIKKELEIIKQEKKSIINEIDKLKILSLNALKQHE